MRFFFYGTLLAGSANRAARLVHEKLQAVGPAVAQGALYAVPDPRGWYPALFAGDGQVRGMLYDAAGSFTPADVARIDTYEDYDPMRPEASLYIREPLPVIGPAGTCSAAETYRFARPLPEGLRPIPSGDFRAWLAEQGVSAFGGLRSAS